MNRGRGFADLVETRWYETGDYDALVSLHLDAYPADLWLAGDFQDFTTTPGAVLKVGVLPGGKLVASLLYRLTEDGLEIVRLAVDRGLRGRGLGRRMIELIIGSASPIRRRRIIAAVDAEDVPAQLFLRHMGFRADRPEPGDEAYLFRFRRARARASA